MADSQRSEENDITMAEPEPVAIKTEEEDKKDVKLDDIFADVESDDEFPSSKPVEEDYLSSTPEEEAALE